ncbi:MAG: alpha/beta fold hydrolase [Candidatus Marinarcus sp.]|uniref:alpha/beta fold hydrolase n=1 Tax=Candidatus Marinarcus sp. TaxID=3100987 RepID=UPI003AFF7CA0
MQHLYKLFIIVLFFSNLHAFEERIKEPIFNEYVYVKTAGNPNKETIVFIHGLGSDASLIWNKTIQKLQKEYYIITFDLPGFGQSSKSKQLYSPENYTRLIFYLTNKYCTKPFYLVGHSMGGALALNFTAKHFGMVKKLMLIDVAGILYKEAYSNFLITARIDKIFNTQFSNQTNDSKWVTSFSNFMNKIGNWFSLNMDEFVSTSTPEVIAGYTLGIKDFSQVIPKIDVPTFILWGQEDSVAPLRTGYILNKMIPNSTLKIITSSGHVPMRDAYDEYFSFLNVFLHKEITPHDTQQTFQTFKKVLRLDKKSNQIISGEYEKIILYNCKNIVIENAKINHLEVFNSSVHILNSTFFAPKTAIESRNASLLITATDIYAQVGIKANSSRLDLAGTYFYTSVDAIENAKSNENTHVIFSLSKLMDKNGNQKSLHGKYILTHSQSL